jgi:hypothetical protein
VNVQQDFWNRVNEEWLPAFCRAHHYDPPGFRPEAKELHDADIRDFLRAVDYNIVTIDAANNFRAPRSNVVEHIFWEGPNTISPRPISLWIEPIITIAAVGRLHLDYGWPIECLGMQSLNWEFDLMAFELDDPKNEHIAGEVKPTRSELDKFLENLQRCCAAGVHDCLTAKSDRKNAHKKWLGLRRSRAPIFWAIGPGGDSRVFDVLYNEGSPIALEPTALEKLHFTNI